MGPFTTAFRPFLRQSVGRRFASTNTEGAQKKAQDALGSVQKNAEKAWESVKKVLGPVGEKAGNMLGCECSCFVHPAVVLRATLFVFQDY
jgi:F-type H+-transporting ATPase subunit g